MSSLADVEDALASLLGQGRRRWQQVAALLCEVRERELWREGGHASLTAWVGALAARLGHQPSHLWRAMSAATRYAEWTGREPADVVECRPGAEKLELAGKIEPFLGEDDAAELRERVLADEPTLAELRERWRQVRPPAPRPAEEDPGSVAPEPQPAALPALPAFPGLPERSRRQLRELAAARGAAEAEVLAELIAAAWQQRQGAPPAPAAAAPLPPPAPARAEPREPAPLETAAALPLSGEQRDVLARVAAGANVFLTGRAGTGKSAVLHELRRSADDSTVFLAPTGRAALNVGAATIHRFFGLPIGMVDPDELRPSGRVRDRLKAARTLVIDEISMVRADVLAGMDALARRVPLDGGKDAPFGGRQVVMVGDFAQLPPVVRGNGAADWLRERFGSAAGWAFASPAWRDLQVETVALSRVFRQDDDVFVALLNQVRDGDGAAAPEISRLCRQDPVPEDVPTLCATNRGADAINQRRLDALPGASRSYRAVVSGDVDLASMPAAQQLHLKPGARVVMLVNGSGAEEPWVNGTLGVVARCDGRAVDIRLDGRPDPVRVGPHTWEIENFEYDPRTKRLRRTVVGTFAQLPVRLGWGMTVHKSQGMTLDAVQIDLGAGAFAHGQAYVALSRARSLHGLWLRTPLRPADVICDEEVRRAISS
jgi:ATP-dependent DNA helicase PIF1